MHLRESVREDDVDVAIGEKVGEGGVKERHGGRVKRQGVGKKERCDVVYRSGNGRGGF